MGGRAGLRIAHSNVDVTLTINNFEIKSKVTINVLGVTFDSKLQWQAQIEKVIKKQPKPNMRFQ